MASAATTRPSKRPILPLAMTLPPEFDVYFTFLIDRITRATLTDVNSDFRRPRQCREYLWNRVHAVVANSIEMRNLVAGEDSPHDRHCTADTTRATRADATRARDRYDRAFRCRHPSRR